MKPYRCTAGKLTIGVGRNLDDVGLIEEEAMYLLKTDIDRAMDDLNRHVPWWRSMTDAQRRALVNMCFNLGWPRLGEFKNMLAGLKAGDFEHAAAEALDSRWASQVGKRSERIAALIRKG